MILESRTLVGVAGTAAVAAVAVIAFMTFMKQEPQHHVGTVEISPVDSNWSVQVSEVR